MEPICYVTRMVRILRYINEEYACQLCFMGWKSKAYQSHMYSHMGRWIMVRRLRALLCNAFTNIKIYTMRRRCILTLGFKVGMISVRFLLRAVFSEMRNYCIMRTALLRMGCQVAEKSVRSLGRKVFSGWLTTVSDCKICSYHRLVLLFGQQTVKAQKCAAFRAWKGTLRGRMKTKHISRTIIHRLQQRFLVKCFNCWKSRHVHCQVLRHRLGRTTEIRSFRCTQSFFLEWSDLIELTYRRRQAIKRATRIFLRRGVSILRSHFKGWVEIRRGMSTLKNSLVIGHLRSHLLMYVICIWRRNIGVWMPRAALGLALARKGLLAISPMPLSQHVSNITAMAISSIEKDSAEDSRAVAKTLHRFVPHSKDPAFLYAMARRLRAVMKSFKWVVNWARMKRHMSWRLFISKKHLCWKIWCLAVSKTHLFRQATLKMVSGTSTRVLCSQAVTVDVTARQTLGQWQRSILARRDKDTAFRTWVIYCTKVGSAPPTSHGVVDVTLCSARHICI